MKALVLEDYMKFSYVEVPEPEITDDDVLVQVKAAGICGSDVHGMDGSSGRRIPPIIMGHEASGVIVRKGKNVKDWHIGDRVTFDSTIYKLDDWYSLNGMYNLSDGRMVFGVSTKEYRKDGAYAEYVAVPQHILYKIPPSLPQFSEKTTDNWMATFSPSGANSLGPSIPAPATRNPTVTTVPISIAMVASTYKTLHQPLILRASGTVICFSFLRSACSP